MAYSLVKALEEGYEGNRVLKHRSVEKTIAEINMCLSIPVQLESIRKFEEIVLATKKSERYGNKEIEEV